MNILNIDNFNIFFIKFDAFDESREGFEEFLETKESLIITLESHERAKYVGMRVVDGWSELYFYADDSKEMSNMVAKIMASVNYKYESSIVRDAKWDFHHKNIYPTELELTHIESEKIIFLLQGKKLFNLRDSSRDSVLRVTYSKSIRLFSSKILRLHR